MDCLTFIARIEHIETTHLIKIPVDISRHFPSRGMNMAEVKMSGHTFVVPLEPDGMGSHWFKVKPQTLSDGTLDVTLCLLSEWPSPELPPDFKDSIESSELMTLWESLTTKAKWEWIRWIRATQNKATREKRILTAGDLLKKGKKRPCCFDQSKCTEPEVSKGGVLQV